jgi:LuxR family maltose regulon positive regulatory protein
MAELAHSATTRWEGSQIYLKRPRIHHLLEEAIQSPVVIVTAGAGYGKTQAVYSFLQTISAITAWLRFSERDNIPDRFWENFAATVGFISRDTAQRLAEQGFPISERRFDRYLAIPRDDVIPHARYIFVYDDFHLIHNREVLRFMEHSIFAPFPNIVSIIISRSDPDFGTAGRGRFVPARITGEDLRFTEEETVKYFRLEGINISRQTCSAVCRDTEGWAFAIRLSALFLKRLLVTDPLQAGHRMPGMRSNIFRLLETELMDSLSPELRKFLIKLSLLDFLPRELLESLNPRKDLIAEMKKIGSFIRWDPYSDSCDIHQLFLEYLTSRQGELEDSEKQEIYRRAARWYLNNGRRINALSYYEKIGDYNSIIDIIDRLPMILPDHTARILKDLLDRTSESLCRENPMLRALYGKICLSLGFFTDCEGLLRRHVKELKESPSPLPQGEEFRCRALLGCYLYLGFAGFVTSMDTRDYGYVEDMRQAAFYQAQGGQMPDLPASVLMLGSYVCRVRDPEPEKIAPYLRAMETGSSYMAEAFRGCMYGIAELARGEYAFFREEIQEAEAFFREALRKARGRGQYEIENRALFYLLRIALYQGNIPDIEEAVLGLGAQKKQEYYFNRSIHLDVVMGWYYTQMGMPEKIAAWLKNDFEEVDLNSRGRGLEILVKTKYHLCKRNYPAALASLSGRQDFEGGLLFGRLEALALEAVCRYAGRDEEGALGCLRNLYETGTLSGVTMPLDELGHFARALADWALKQETEGLDQAWLLERRRNAAAYAKKVFPAAEAFQEKARPGKTPAPQSPRRYSLSPREQEILVCLSRGLTRTEIAGTLSLSINTIKSLIRSVYNKLGAVNRSHAIQTAAAAGLLEKVK